MKLNMVPKTASKSTSDRCGQKMQPPASSLPWFFGPLLLKRAIQSSFKSPQKSPKLPPVFGGAAAEQSRLRRP